MIPGLFDSSAHGVIPGMFFLPNFCDVAQMTGLLEEVLAHAPLRTMTVPGGKHMSVMTSSAGTDGWTSDATGYLYSNIDPLSGSAWPAIPPAWRAASQAAAAAAGFAGFAPDACLINRYTNGARMGLHQDRDEADTTQPIVSFSFGAPAKFFFTLNGTRTGPTRSIALHDGDALVFGGPARMIYHGVRPLRIASNEGYRVNLTFRRVAL